MSRLLIPIAALLVSGLLAASASAMPVDANHDRSVAAQKYYRYYGDFNRGATPAPIIDTDASPAVSDETSGPGWTLAIAAGVVLVVAAAGGGALFGRAHARPGHRLA
jgi:hypothetical protein